MPSEARGIKYRIGLQNILVNTIYLYLYICECENSCSFVMTPIIYLLFIALGSAFSDRVCRSHDLAL